MKVTEHTIKTAIKNHPNDVRYPCRATHEVIDAGRKLITILSPSERNDMLEGKLILNEEETVELYDAIMVKDVIGLGIFRGTDGPIPGFSSNMYLVEKIVKDSDYMECKNFYTKEIEEISFQDISIGLSLNMAEILYRDDKPFGAPTEQEWTIKIHSDDEEETTTAEKIVANLQAQDSEEESNSEKDIETNIEKTVEFPECYHSFGYVNDTYCVILNSKEYWDGDKKELVSVKHLATKLNFIPIEGYENTFEYDHKYSTTQLKALFTSFACEENTEMNSILE